MCWKISLARCFWIISHGANMVIVQAALRSAPSFHVNTLLLIQVVLMFYHRVVNTTESLGHGGGGGGRGGGGLQLWSYGTSFTPALRPGSRRESLNLPFNKNLSSQVQVSTRPALTSPACCSCDLTARSAARGGRRSHRVESVACRVALCDVGYFCTSKLSAPAFFSEMSLIRTSTTTETY